MSVRTSFAKAVAKAGWPTKEMAGKAAWREAKASQPSGISRLRAAILSGPRGRSGFEAFHQFAHDVLCVGGAAAIAANEQLAARREAGLEPMVGDPQVGRAGLELRVAPFQILGYRPHFNLHADSSGKSPNAMARAA